MSVRVAQLYDGGRLQMIYAPSHIKKYLKQISENNKFFGTPIYGEFTFGYEVQCSCGNHEFAVFKNSEPKVSAVCESCGNQITVYDLIEYPCATTARNPEEPLEKVVHKGNDKFNIAIVIQYSDEFTFDDEMFDENDITWCQIYLYDNAAQESVMIVDDETA